MLRNNRWYGACTFQLIETKKHFQKEAQMLVGEVMTRNVEVIGASAPLIEAAAKMKDLDVGLIPVCEADELKGTLTDRDITVRGIAEGYNPSETKVSDIMSTDLAYCFEDEEIEEALNIMEARQIRRLPVLSREKRLVGIVSLGDLAVHSGQRELVGETLKEVSQPAIPRR
jgi:CBS domain-containing protein